MASMDYFMPDEYSLTVSVEVMASLVACVFITKFVAPKVHMLWYSEFDKFTPAEQTHLNARFTTIVYASATSLISLYVVLLDSQLTHDKIRGRSWIAQVNIAMVLGYASSDLYFMALYKKYWDRLIIIHHIFVMAGAVVFLVTKGIWYFVALRLLSEISTPFLCFALTLGQFYKRKGELYKIFGLLTFVMFFLVRVMMIPLYYYLFIKEALPQSLDALNFATWLTCAIIVDIMNVYWFTKICAGVCTNEKT